MKLFVNCSGPKVGTGKIQLENILELITLEDALKHYKDHLSHSDKFTYNDLENKLKIVDKMIDSLRVDNAERQTKKFESNLGIGLSEFLRNTRLEKSISLKDMAQKLTVKPYYYHCIEKELIPPSTELLMKAFSTLNVLCNIKVRLHSHMCAIEYYYNNLKITELTFKFSKDYIHDCEIIKNSIPTERIDAI